jgi:hypothetical protein
MGTSRTITCTTDPQKVSCQTTTGEDKSDPNNSNTTSSFSPLPNLEFHPYAYLNFTIPLPYSLPVTPMSDYSINTSNKSPNQIPPHSPPLPIPLNPVQTTIAPQYLPLLPQTALNTLTTQMDLNKTICTIAYGLISTVHNREVLHALESK